MRGPLTGGSGATPQLFSARKPLRFPHFSPPISEKSSWNEWGRALLRAALANGCIHKRQKLSWNETKKKHIAPAWRNTLNPSSELRVQMRRGFHVAAVKNNDLHASQRSRKGVICVFRRWGKNRSVAWDRRKTKGVRASEKKIVKQPVQMILHSSSGPRLCTASGPRVLSSGRY